ncbi:hypothetical protein [Azospirillum doebereinerae]
MLARGGSDGASNARIHCKRCAFRHAKRLASVPRAPLREPAENGVHGEAKQRGTG